MWMTTAAAGKWHHRPPTLPPYQSPAVELVAGVVADIIVGSNEPIPVVHDSSLVHHHHRPENERVGPIIEWHSPCQ